MVQRLIEKLELATATVYPSGGARRVVSIAMLPNAPARLSTTMGCPSASCIFFPTTRPTTSLPVPGGNGISMLINWLGEGRWALANPLAHASADITKARRVRAGERKRSGGLIFQPRAYAALCDAFSDRDGRPGGQALEMPPSITGPMAS